MKGSVHCLYEAYLRSPPRRGGRFAAATAVALYLMGDW